MRTGGLLLSIACLALAGCTYRWQQAGDDGFRRERPAWEPVVGETTMLETARALGPPDQIVAGPDAIWFVYRYRSSEGAGIAVSYFLKVFAAETASQVDSTLAVAFDRHGRLLHHGSTFGEADLGVPGL